MMKQSVHKRRFLKTVLASAVAQCLPSLAFAQSSIRIRLEWQQFKTTSQYQSFLNGIAAMRANTNPSDRGSLQFWANVHVNHCPHGTPYFIAWHRGYLHYFEQQLRIASGDPQLNIPYWDYYAYSTMPVEFTNPAPDNPLYRQRMSTDVYNALDLLPFAPGVYNFQHGTENAFEPKLENVHNSVHNLLGGIMATMQSPLDPVFYLHHANLDRLTHAWALPDGKGIPLSAFPYSPTNSDPYWADSHVYASDLSLERWWTLIPRWLGNDYANSNVPTALPPPVAATARAVTGIQAGASRTASTTRPPFQAFTPVPGRRLSEDRRSLGGASQLALDERSLSISVLLDKEGANELAKAVARGRAGREAPVQDKPVAIKLVIDRALLSGLGQDGGYFYALYLNMPARSDSLAARQRSFVGSLGPFQIVAASHHGPARIEYDVTGLLAAQVPSNLSALSVSLVRVDGDNAPSGRTIIIGEIRLELAYDAQPVRATPLTKPPGWYRGR